MFIPLNIPITAMNTTVLTEAPTLWSRTNLMAVFVMDSFPSWFSATFPSLFGGRERVLQELLEGVIWRCDEQGEEDKVEECDEIDG
jgi:hypothetical protein